MKIGRQIKQNTIWFNYTYSIEISIIPWTLKKTQCIGYIFLLGERATDKINTKYNFLY